MTLQLRDYQRDTHERMDAAEARGVRRQLVHAATGLGKTVIFGSYAQRRGQRTVVLAHRDELIGQAVAKVLEVWPEVGATDNALALLLGSDDPHLQALARKVDRNPRGVGVVKAEADDVNAWVVVASVQTLSRARRLQRLVATTSPDDWSLVGGQGEPIGLVVVDEAHHTTAPSYRTVLAALRAGAPAEPCPDCAAAAGDVCLRGHVQEGGELHMLPPGPLLVGVTATVDRGDGKGLSDDYDEIVASWDLLWGIRAGYLADLRGVHVRLDQLDMARVKVSKGDYDAGASGRALTDAGAPEFIVQAWLADHQVGDEVVSARGRKTLVFTPTVAVAEAIAAEFVGVGVAAAMVSGETPTDERRRLLGDFRAGRLTVLANCAVLTEGYDEPSVECVVVARPTKSRGLYTQMVGRGTRLHPEKDYCLVLDVVGASSEHSLLTIPSLFGIDRKVRPYRPGESLVGAITEQEHELVRLGRMRAEEADLFAQVRRQGLAWVAIHQVGDPLRRYVLQLGKGTDDKPLPLVVLAQREADVWTAGLQWPDGTKQVLLANTSMETAQGAAEVYVRNLGPRATALVDSDARWRKGPPSAGQLNAAAKWHFKTDPNWNAGQLSDALAAHITRIKARNRRPKRKATR